VEKIHQKKSITLYQLSNRTTQKSQKKRVSRTFDAITEYLSKNSQKIKKQIHPITTMVLVQLDHHPMIFFREDKI
jgi:hypothetical protein